MIKLRYHIWYVLILFCLTHVSFAGEFLTEIKASYDQLFSEHANTKFVMEKLVKNGKSAAEELFPKGMLAPHILLQSTRRLFDISNVHSIRLPFKVINKIKDKKLEHAMNAIDKKLKNTHLEIIKAYWLGYIAFLEELTGTEGKWLEFERNFPKMFTIPLFKSPLINVEYYNNTNQLEESNKHELLPMFLIHYSLGTFFQESASVSNLMRIKALQFWQRIDPDMKFFRPKNKKYFYGMVNYLELRKNLLPVSFSANQEISSKEFFSHPIIVNTLGYCRSLAPGYKEIFEQGLKTLLDNYPEEVIQILHSLLQLSSDEPNAWLGNAALKFLFDTIYRQEVAISTSILGEQASYRKKGALHESLDSESSLKLWSQQKQHYKALIASLKKNLIMEGARTLLNDLEGDNNIDANDWFRTFMINPLLSFEINQKNIDLLYKELLKERNLDKNPNSMDLLKIAHDNLSNEASYEDYLEKCWGNALRLAEKKIEGIYQDDEKEADKFGPFSELSQPQS